MKMKNEQSQMGQYVWMTEDLEENDPVHEAWSAHADMQNCPTCLTPVAAEQNDSFTRGLVTKNRAALMYSGANLWGTFQQGNFEYNSQHNRDPV